MFHKLILILILASCSTVKKTHTEPAVPKTPKEFSAGELILSTELLTRIFDQEMAPLSCVSDIDEASLLLRTIRPRMEVVEDDLIALLDNSGEVQKLIESCDKNCTCSYLEDLMREHQVHLSKKQKKLFNEKKSEKEVSRCLNYVQSTFCESELYKTLNEEKEDFTFEEET